MGLQIKVILGPLKGQVFPLRTALTIGRSGATISINDPKVSTAHARVTEAGGVWHLRDQNSKNGIRDVEGARITVLELKPGAFFAIGDSQFEVEAREDQPAAEPLEPTAVAAPPKPAAPKKKKIFWNDALASFLEKNSDNFHDQCKKIEPLEPALVLEFVRGAQVNSRWVLGFGPRRIGAACLDLPIWEPNAPDICFEIHPSDDGLLFQTAHSEIVHLNGQAVDSQVLRMGDTISIDETLIEVDFTE